MEDQGHDFFISYTGVNQRWAEWIAVQLESTGFTTVLQSWDFRPGSDFVHKMQMASSTARRTIAVLSPAYFGSEFSEAEWRVAFAKDPSGEQGLLVPVRVEHCKPPGLLTGRVYVDLVGVDEATGRRRLLDAVAKNWVRPTSAEYPGTVTAAPEASARWPGSGASAGLGQKRRPGRMRAMAFLLGLSFVVVAAGIVWGLSSATTNPPAAEPNSASAIAGSQSAPVTVVESHGEGSAKTVIEGSLGIANVTAGDTNYGSGVTAKAGDVIKLQAYYNNREVDDSDRIAEQLKVVLDWEPTTDGDWVVNALISGDNTTTVKSSAYVVMAEGSTLEPVQDSGAWRHNQGGNDNPHIVDTAVGDSPVGYGVIVGDVPPLYSFSGTITYMVRAVGRG